MKVVVIGASGRTGRYLVEKAVAAGHHVTAFVRTPEKMPAVKGVTVVAGDARNVTDLVKVLKGQDAVLSALGTTKLKDTITFRSTEALIAAAQQTGLKRVIVMSSFLAAPNFKPNFIGKLMSGMLKGLVTDKENGEVLLTASKLDWTLIYPTMLDKVKAGGNVRVVKKDESVGMNNAIAREDVASFMVKTLSKSDTIHKRILITTR